MRLTLKYETIPETQIARLFMSLLVCLLSVHSAPGQVKWGENVIVMAGFLEKSEWWPNLVVAQRKEILPHLKT